MTLCHIQLMKEGYIYTDFVFEHHDGTMFPIAYHPHCELTNANFRSHVKLALFLGTIDLYMHSLIY